MTDSPFQKTPAEADATEQLKVATQLSYNENWEEAIAMIRPALAVLAAGNMSYPVKTYCRLPRYLQQAGRYDEACEEFQRLIDTTPERVSRNAGRSTAAQRNFTIRAERKIIKDEWAISTRREQKRLKKASAG